MLLASLILFLLSATVGTRILLGQFTPGFHEYEAIFAYGSDVFLVLFLFATFVFRRHPDPPSANWRRRRSLPAGRQGSHEILPPLLWRQNDKEKRNFKLPITNLPRGPYRTFRGYYLPITVFLLVAGISIFFAPAKLLALYQCIRLLAVVAMAFAVARVAKHKRTFQVILGTIAVLAVVQAGIGIAQFTHQKAIGLSWLGESPISPTDGGSSKILVNNSRVLRAYGLFPHPNILAAFLVLGLFALIYFYLKADKELYGKLFDYKKGIGENFRRFIGSRFLYIRIAVAVGIFIVFFGLVLTFSRSAWLAVCVSLLFLIVSLFFSRRVSIRSLLRLLFLLFAICALLFAILRPFILPRATLSRTEQAVDLRLRYNDLALKLIREHPLGVGIGNQVLFSVREKEYQSLSMTEVWQWQPIHNLYLLMASEIGILGFLAFFVFIIWIFFHWSLIRPARMTEVIQSGGNYKLEIENSRAMLLALLTLGVFDHFLWTIWQGKIMLWLVIGLVWGLTNGNAESYNNNI